MGSKTKIVGQMTQEPPVSAEPWPTLKMFDLCSPRELIRVSLAEGRTVWAIKGQPENPKLLPLLVLINPPAAAPYFEDIINNKALREQLPVLSYGFAYRLEPIHGGRCDVVSGPLFAARGSLLVSPAGRFIQAEFRPQSVTAYYNIDSGVVMYQAPFAPGQAAAFENWVLWLVPPPEHAAVLTYGSGASIEGVDPLSVGLFTAQQRPAANPLPNRYEEIK
jgi:hypothetical protein